MVLVSIVGDFHSSVLPIFYEFKDKIKAHILIYDDLKKDVNQANHLINGIENFKNKYNLSFEHRNYKIDKDSKYSIESLQTIFNIQYNDISKLYINATDGNATINSLLSLKLIPLGAKIIAYDRFDNQANIISNNGLKILKLKKSIPIKDYFLLKNIETKYDNDKNRIIKNQKQIKSLYQEHLDKFLKLRTKRFEEVSSIQNNEVVEIIKKLVQEFQPEESTKFMNGTLYEFYIAILLLDMNIDDFEVGITLFTQEKGIFNEFDVVFSKNNHVHMIECKMARPDLSSLMYKLVSLKERLDDDGKMAIFSRHDNYYRKVEEGIDNDILPKRRAIVNDILLRGFVFKNEDKFFKDMEDFFKLIMINETKKFVEQI